MSQASASSPGVTDLSGDTSYVVNPSSPAPSGSSYWPYVAAAVVIVVLVAAWFLWRRRK